VFFNRTINNNIKQITSHHNHFLMSPSHHSSQTGSHHTESTTTHLYHTQSDHACRNKIFPCICFIWSDRIISTWQIHYYWTYASALQCIWINSQNVMRPHIPITHLSKKTSILTLKNKIHWQPDLWAIFYLLLKDLRLVIWARAEQRVAIFQVEANKNKPYTAVSLSYT
jgi:hypothetical protein